MAQVNGYIWPEIITDENFNYPLPSDNKTLGRAIADGLTAWAGCQCGVKPPENFGVGMVKIACVVGTAAPDGLMKASDDFLSGKDSEK